MILLLSLAYLVASLVADVTKISQSHDVAHAGAGDSVALDVPVLLFDLIFLVWIYLALVNIMATLRACGQTHKLDMCAARAPVAPSEGAGAGARESAPESENSVAPLSRRYTRLAYVIGTFVALVSLLTVVIFVSRLGAFEWPWEYRWVQTVLLEVRALGLRRRRRSPSGGRASRPRISAVSNRCSTSPSSRRCA